MDGTTALLNLRGGDLEGEVVSDNAYGAAAPVAEEREDFYGSVLKGANEDTAADLLRPEWLRGDMSRSDAEMLLLSDPVPGNFLVRESKARPGTFAISLVIHDGRVEHHTLAPRNGTYLLNNKPMARACATLEDVVDHLTFTEESLSCTLRPRDPRQVVANPGYQFSATVDRNGRPLVPNAGYEFAAANPLLFSGMEEPDSLYTALPSNRPADRGYVYADHDAPALPPKSSYMEIGPDSDEA
jgi:hypothetical protein